MTLAARNIREMEADVLHAEILWLASFSMARSRIARTLGVSVDAVDAHLTGKQSDTTTLD